MVQATQSEKTGCLWALEDDEAAELFGRTPRGTADSDASNAGLSLAHNSTEENKVLALNAQGGSYLRIGSAVNIHGRPGGGGKRGAVCGCSRASLKRMADELQSIDRRQVTATFFVTLTVPTGEGEWKEMERWRKAYCERLRRAWGDSCAGFWKKEPHKSGTPHMHWLLLWFGSAPDLAQFRAWNDAAWSEVVGSDNPHHKERGCRVELMRTWKGASWYLDKYLGKEIVVALGVKTGRIWGKYNQHLLQKDLTPHELEIEVAKRAKRSSLRLSRHRSVKWQVSLGCNDEGVRIWLPMSQVLDRFRRQGMKSFDIPLQAQIAKFKGLGFPVRRRSLKCGRNLTYEIWADGFDGHPVSVGSESHFVPHSVCYLDYQEGERLIKAARDSFALDPLTVPLRLRAGRVGRSPVVCHPFFLK